MTVHDLHDALNDLPSDLITAADRVRTKQTPKVIRWQRWVSLAAVLTLVVGTTLVFRKNIGFDSLKGAGVMPESVMQQAPAAAAPMAPAPVEDEVAAEEAMPEPPSDIGAPEVPYEEAGDTKAENSLSVDHSHRFAEGEEGGRSTAAYCGNMEVTIDVAGEQFVISGTDAVRVTDILVNLTYDPAHVCRCMTDITVDTETLKDIRLDTAQGFARCEKGQAALTEEQARILQDIIDSLR